MKTGATAIGATEACWKASGAMLVRCEKWYADIVQAKRALAWAEQRR